MLSFELSAIDVVLVVAVLILFSLYVGRKPGASKTEPKSNVENAQKLQEKPKMTAKTQKSKAQAAQPPASFQKCAHHFGYLRNLPRNTPVPDECFGCPRVMRCLFESE